MSMPYDICPGDDFLPLTGIVPCDAVNINRQPPAYQPNDNSRSFEDGVTNPLFRVSHVACAPKRRNEFGDREAMLFTVEAECVVNITWYNEIGQKISEFVLKSYSSHPDSNEAIRRCIQGILNHDYEPKYSVFDNDSKLRMGQKIHYYFGNLSEPWKSLFEQLFTSENWESEFSKRNTTKQISSH